MTAIESPILKLLPVSLLVTTTSISIAMFSISKRTFTGSFSDLVNHNRAIVGTVVQVSATLLATAQVYVLCSIVNFAARLRVSSDFVPLSFLKLLSALSMPRLDWTLSWNYFPAVAIVVAFGPIFGAIWAGILTPLTTLTIRQDGTIQVPQYTGALKPAWTLERDGSISLNCTVKIRNLPEFQSVSDCAAVDAIGGLLASAQAATNPQGKPTVHSKLENAAWTYSGRSYGVGSSQGLFSPSEISTDAYTAYTYQEVGYLSEVACIHNFSSSITVTSTGYGDGLLSIWTVNGSLPNMPETFRPYLVTAMWPSIDLLTWSAAAANGRNMIAIASVGWYNSSDLELDKIQCSITFAPTLFSVAVNLTQSLIQVTPKSTFEEFEKTGSLISITMANLDLVSRMNSNMVVSQLGNALKYNLVNVNASTPGLSPSRLAERTVEDSVTAILDDLLVAQGAAQMAVFNTSTTTSVEKCFEAVQIGTARFSIAMLVINAVLVVLVISEASRTRFWHRLPSFNFTNIETVILTALASPASHNLNSNGLVCDTEPRASYSSLAAEAAGVRVKWQCDRDGRAIVVYQSSVRSAFEGQGPADTEELVPLRDLKQPRVMVQSDSFRVPRKPLPKTERGYARLVE
jgi:hypothetical protein